MNTINNLKIGTRLIGGFLIITSIFAAFIIYNYIVLQNLGVTQDAGAKWGRDALIAKETSMDADKLGAAGTSIGCDSDLD